MENSFNILEKNGIIWMNIYDECDNIIKNTMDNFIGQYSVIHKGYQLAIKKC